MVMGMAHTPDNEPVTTRAITKQDIAWRVTGPGRFMLWITIPGMPKMRTWIDAWMEDEAVGRYLQSVNTDAVKRHIAKKMESKG